MPFMGRSMVRNMTAPPTSAISKVPAGVLIDARRPLTCPTTKRSSHVDRS
jgi:hypothetical protein